MRHRRVRVRVTVPAPVTVPGCPGPCLGIRDREQSPPRSPWLSRLLPPLPPLWPNTASLLLSTAQTSLVITKRFPPLPRILCRLPKLFPHSSLSPSSRLPPVAFANQTPPSVRLLSIHHFPCSMGASLPCPQHIVYTSPYCLIRSNLFS